MIWPGGDTFFHQIFFLKKPNTSECGQVLVVMWVKLDCVKALLSPDPTLIYKFCHKLIFFIRALCTHQGTLNSSGHSKLTRAL